MLKFKNLLHLELDATLSLKSEAGIAVVTLSVKPGHIHSAPVQGHPHRYARNCPSRQRRNV